MATNRGQNQPEAPPNGTRTTSFDIAYLAGVSQSTVSRALRGEHTVNAETRRRISRIAADLGYKVDKNASALRRRHSNTLAVLFFEDQTSDASRINPFFLTMIGSIIRASSARGYDLLVSFQKLTDDMCADYETSRKADGIILLGYGNFQTYRRRLEQLVAQGTHFVRYGAALDGHPGISVGSDNYLGGRLATQHLLSLGRRRIAFLGHTSDRYPEFAERYRGYADVLTEAGLIPAPALQAGAISTVESGRHAAEMLLNRKTPFDAIFAASDLIAIGALGVLQSAGHSVPEDVSLVGFDNITLSALVKPAITTVTQDTGIAGEVLVDTLLQLIDGGEATPRTLPPKLEIRDSCGASHPERLRQPHPLADAG